MSTGKKRMLNLYGISVEDKHYITTPEQQNQHYYYKCELLYKYTKLKQILQYFILLRIAML